MPIVTFGNDEEGIESGPVGCLMVAPWATVKVLE